MQAPLLLGAALLALLPACTGARAAQATAEQAVALVRQAVAYIQARGAEDGHAEISRPGGRFSHEERYVVVYGLDGVVLAHGANPKMVGRNLLAMKDIDGKPFVRERVDKARTQAAFWQDYKFTNPATRKVEPKRMYCERLDDSVVCGGIYR